MELYPLTMCYFIKRAQKCTKLFLIITKQLNFMIFNSFQFIWLFPVIFVGYYLLHALFKNSSKERVRRWGNAFLLIASYGLYIQWNPAYALILLGVTAVTYLTALLIERKEAYGRKKYIIYTGG